MNELKKRILYCGKEIRVWVYIAIATSMALSLFEALLGFLIQACFVVLKVVPQDSIHPFFAPLVLNPSYCLAALAGCAVVRGIVQYYSIYSTNEICNIFTTQKKKALFSALLQPEEHVLKHRFTPGKTQALANLYLNSAAVYVKSIINTLIGFLQAGILIAVLARLSAGLLTTSLLGIFILAFFIRLVSKSLQKFNARLYNGDVKVSSLQTGILQNLVLMKLYRTERIELRQAGGEIDKVQSALDGQAKVISISQALPQIFGIFLFAGIVLTTLAFPGIIQGRHVMTFLYILLRLTVNLGTIGGNIGYIYSCKDGFEEYYQNIDPAHEENASERTAEAEPENLKKAPSLRIEKLSFNYDGREKIIQDLSVNMQGGECILIYGPSGSGKSTLLSLLLGLIQPTEGKITWDEKNLTDTATIQQLRNSVGYVGVESWIKEGSILENLCYGLHEHPSDARLTEALQKAHAYDFVMAKGLQYRLGQQGNELSTGQKQRLSMARAFLRNPKVLVFDEATSHLDRKTEQNILGVLKSIKGEFTMIVSSHNPEFKPLADVTLDLERLQGNTG